MTPPRSRTPLLAAASLLLGALVVADRTGLLPGATPPIGPAADDSPASRYAVAAHASTADAALLDRAEEWNAAAEIAESQWRTISENLVRGGTAELAETRFREIVKSAMQDIPLASPERITYMREGTTTTGSVRTLRLNVAFDAYTPKDAYTIIDRLENMPDARARIELLKIEGPGRIQSPEQVTVTLTLSAAALIGDAEAPS